LNDDTSLTTNPNFHHDEAIFLDKKAHAELELSTLRESNFHKNKIKKITV